MISTTAENPVVMIEGETQISSQNEKKNKIQAQVTIKAKQKQEIENF